MSLATIILVLQMAVSLLANPNLSNNAAAKAQAFDFANQAIALANQALVLPATTTLQDVISTSTPPAVPEIATSTDDGTGVGTGAATVPAPVNDTSTLVEAAPSDSVIPTPRHITVLFSANSDGDGFVTVTDDAGVSVRIKNLDVQGGTLAGITIGTIYGEGTIYASSFTDGVGNTFDRLSCNGLGSLGQAIEYGGNIDPCARKDRGGAINELQQGETMILRYTGSVTGINYEAGSIVEVGTGNDVTF